LVNWFLWWSAILATQWKLFMGFVNHDSRRRLVGTFLGSEKMRLSWSIFDAGWWREWGFFWWWRKPKWLNLLEYYKCKCVEDLDFGCCN
jgi:hypothetical protein